MHPFTLERPRDLAAALAFRAQAGRNDAPAEYIAGGTDMVQLLQEYVRRPERLVSLAGLLDNRIEVGPQGLRLGAAATMAEVAAHPAVDRAVSRHLRGAAELGEPAGAQPGDHGRQPPAAHPLPLFSRCRLRRLQQARAGLRLRRDRRREPLACRARHERELHRRQPVRPRGRAGRARCSRRGARGERTTHRAARSTFTGCPATRRTSRRCSNPAR